MSCQQTQNGLRRKAIFYIMPQIIFQKYKLQIIMTIAIIASFCISKIIAALLIFFFYLIIQQQKNEVKAFYKPTKLNTDMVNHLQPFLQQYKPTFYAPTFVSMVYVAQKHTKQTKKLQFGIKKIQYPNNGTIYVETFPHNFDDMPQDMPIVMFAYGAFGNLEVAYPRQFALIVQKYKMRAVYVSRRGFNNQPIDSDNMLSVKELEDFGVITKYLKQNYKANIYILGISMGSSIISQRLAIEPENYPIKAFVSIQNPYDVSNQGYWLKHGNILQRFFSLKITKNGGRRIVRYHHKQDQFRKIFQNHGFDADEYMEDFDKYDHIYDIQNKYNVKMKNLGHIFEYYDFFCCRNNIKDIKVPSLFINSLDDEIAAKERIPFAELYKNENIITLTFQRGGHIEFLSGWKKIWYGFETALKYFEYFEKNYQIQLIQFIDNNGNFLKEI